MNEPYKNFLRIWLPVLLWMLFIFILSSVPGKNIPNLPIPNFHKVVHFFEYSILGGLWVRAFFIRRSGVSCFKFSILAWVLTAVFALSDEWHQTFIPGRSGKLDDVFFDMICATCGILFYIFMQNFLKKQKSQN